MKYASHLKKIFKDTRLYVEDLLLLESFQIKDMVIRAPQKEFATLLRAHPIIHQFLIHKEPSVEKTLSKLLKINNPINDPKAIDDHCNEVMWEVGELIIYNKFPEVYDSKIHFNWKLQEIISPELLKNKTVADAGAGPGVLCFLLSPYCNAVYAIEPLSSFRNYIRKRIQKNSTNNIFPMEGFLDAIPLPRHSVDILFTSNALGWNFEKEQQEIERVVKPGGQAIHLMRAFDQDAESPHHTKLLDYNYHFQKLPDKGFKARYAKTFQKTFCAKKD